MSMLTPVTREVLEERERQTLSSLACLSSESEGRAHLDTPDPYRTAFQRDRDRILHCKSFRRLSHKTQVFLAPEGDHYRTRLTHTLEVTQIACSIARSLGLNEDLTCAIGLGHDLGHTPFGHTGEAALCESIARYRGISLDDPSVHGLYRHNLQSVRIVDVLEREGKGLNLSREVVDGIKHHTGKERAKTLEGKIVATADRIAYVNHDIDDAIRAGLLTEADLPAHTHEVLGTSASERITTMTQDMIVNSARVGDIFMSDEIWEALLELRAFLFENVYMASDAKREEPKARHVVSSLFEYYIDRIDEVPQEYRRQSTDDQVTQVVDYISGMTDRFAIRTYEEIKIPRSWRL